MGMAAGGAGAGEASAAVAEARSVFGNDISRGGKDGSGGYDSIFSVVAGRGVIIIIVY